MIDLESIVITPQGFLDVKVAALVAVLATQWLKKYLPDWRFTNLLALGITEIVEVLAVISVYTSNGESLALAPWFAALWVGVLGASLATFGYEGLVNVASLAGIGPRPKSTVENESAVDVSAY